MVSTAILPNRGARPSRDPERSEREAIQGMKDIDHRKTGVLLEALSAVALDRHVAPLLAMTATE